MRITLIDDSLPFDGYTPGSQPLGGAEKAFASLPGALARRGHEVSVFNRCRFRMNIEGAQWETWDQPRPSRTDVLVAFRKPALLDAVRQAGKRLLWLTAPAGYLEKGENRRIVEGHSPRLVFLGPAHQASYGGRLSGALLRPGVRYEYLDDTPAAPAAPPRAIVTTHPMHGLGWLLRMWCERIHAACPEAELHLYSMVLDKGQLGGEVPDVMKPVLAQALAAREHGVSIHRPRGDDHMAEAYRAARVHLYPGHAEDMACWTLAESQATGLPAVARPLGAVRERICDGETGYVVPDDDAFVNVALRILTDDGVFWGMNRDGRLHQRGRSWDVVAAEFEALL